MKQRVIAALCILSMVGPIHLHAETEESPDSSEVFGTVEVRQVTPLSGMFGEWTLFRPENNFIEGRHESSMIDDARSGSYTIVIDPPEAAVASVEIFVNGERVIERDTPQATFSMEDGDNATVVINYTFVRTGIVSVQSEPSGLDFDLVGPNGFETSGTTPDSFHDVPEGLYSASFEHIEGCIEAKPVSDRLVKDSRITLDITIACDALDDLDLGQDQQKKLDFVTVHIDGEEVTFHDVAVSAWYSTYVHTVSKTGITSGYRDASGKLTGEYGPSNNITLAELAKIAHKIATLDESRYTREPANVRARGTWFQKYWSSAEDRGWLVFRDTRQDPGRNATRAEVVATLLQAMDIRRKWPKGTMFTDVSMTTPYGSSIETAATDGLIAGYTDRNGTPTGEFGPNNPINRAEMAKIVSLAIDLYKEDTLEVDRESY